MIVELDDEAAEAIKVAAESAKKPLQQWLRESLCRAAAMALHDPSFTVARVSPLHPGAMQATADFNAPLEEFAAYV